MEASERKRLINLRRVRPPRRSGPDVVGLPLAAVASAAGLHAEVRLAGDAGRVARADGVANSTRGTPSYARRCVPAGVRRNLAQILTEVAEGRSQLIYMGER
jgi:hypothetical protein